MKKIVILFVIVLLQQISHGQEKYAKLWNQAEQYELQLLPKSALKIVDSIYALAQQDKNEPQLIKTLFFKGKFTLTLEEDAKLKVINQFKEAIENSSGASRSVLQNILAQTYWEYFKSNRYQFYKRTTTEKKVDTVDFRSWDLKTIFKEIHHQFSSSLANKELLQKIPVHQYNAILYFDRGTRAYRPTLYDLLMHHALEFYKSEEPNITKPSYAFKIDNPGFYASPEQFSSLKITSKDSLSQHLYALNAYQDLTKFHLASRNKKALGVLDLQRLIFVHTSDDSKEKATLFLDALKRSASYYTDPEISGLFKYEIAEIYVNQAGTSFNPKDTSVQFKNKEALTLLEEVIITAPNSVAAKKSETLKARILRKRVFITNEQNIPARQHSRLLVEHKNLDQLYFSMYKVTYDQYEKFAQMRQEKQVEFLGGLEKMHSWISKLKNEGDHLQHTTEIVVPSLEYGNYLFIASESPEVTAESIYGSSKVQVTDIAIVENTGASTNVLQILDRNTGKPLEKTFVHIKTEDKIKPAINKKLKTDHNGSVYFTAKKYYYNVNVTVIHKKDTAHFDRFYFYRKNRNYNYKDDDEEIHIKPFVFTDRAIYRPGQKLYFKVIAIKKIGDRSELFTDEYIDVTLFNPNNEVVKIHTVKLNEYGSVAGEFDIPNNGLTGKYYINIDEDYEHDSKFYNRQDVEFEEEETIINVEEYKRPTFEVTFDEIEKSYRVNDIILIQGNSASYSGAKVSNADVRYTVKRKVNYPSWRFRYYIPQTSEQVITHGETTTDDDGSFQINFKAIPDTNAKKEDYPIFQYEVTADITDINGETRSQTTIVKVGYHMMTASLFMKEDVDRTADKEQLKINVSNLNGVKLNAKGTLAIYKLKAPDQPLRNRPWAAPDYQQIPEKEFRKLFPHDAYTTGETDVKNWKRGTKVWNVDFDTETNLSYNFTPSSRWKTGKYIAILETQDRYGNPVKTERIFSLFDTKSKKVSDSQLFYLQSDKAAYYIGETAKITIGTAAKDLTVTMIVEKDHKIVKLKTIRLKNEKKTFSVNVNEEDKDGFAVKFHFSVYNDFHSHVKIINIAKPEESIKIITNVFRDQSEPGKKETWSFTVQDDAKNKVTAELLASMFDTSLDQFIKHSWAFQPKQLSSYTSYTTINGRKSFQTSRFRFKNDYPYVYRNNIRLHFDKIQKFGFNINTNYWSQQSYLKQLKARRENSRSEYDKIVSGKVIDKDGGLPGVSVQIKGTMYGTDTDFDGNYVIRVKEGDILVFNYLGYETEEMAVKGKKNVNATLIEGEEALEEVVVAAYGRTSTSKKKTASLARVRVDGKTIESVPMNSVDQVLQGAAAGVTVHAETGQSGQSGTITIRGLSTLNSEQMPLFIVDGVVVSIEEFQKIQSDDVADISVLKDAAATAIYGNRGVNGVFLLSTKKGKKKIDQELAAIKARKNFQETAFFFPQLRTNEKGEVTFSFTMPESLTRWKLQLLAHTTDLRSNLKVLESVTQKKLMVVPNAPRFLRESDEIVISSKINNLSDENLSGFVKLELTDAITGKNIDLDLNNSVATKNFQVKTKGNTVVSWKLQIPATVDAVQYKVVAKAGDFSDGEQNTLPVLSNRMLVTETLPIWARSNQTKTFELEKLSNTTSSTLKHHKLTLEMTSNPAWYALQSLPYLMEYPYECAEQTFARYYANTLASTIANSNPKIKTVFEKWKTSEALLSNLEKNEELKSMIIQETPWLRDAQSETQQKKRIGLLFDLDRMKNELSKSWRQLVSMQKGNGGFPWFKGGRYASNYITQHIVSGFGHLEKLGILKFDKSQKKMLDKANDFLEDGFALNYSLLLKAARDQKNLIARENFLKKKRIGHYEIQYLYGQSFYDSIENPKAKEAASYFMKQAKKYWQEFNLYSKAQIAMIHWRNGDKNFAKRIMRSLEENSIVSEELGMYWKENRPGYFYYQSPIETQSFLIEAFAEITQDTTIVENLQIWLLKNKQTNRWKTTKATTEAIYALLLSGKNWLAMDETVSVMVGEETIDPSTREDIKMEAGTGYFKTSWNGDKIKPNMGTITVTTKNEGMTWGGLYWQYFEDLDNITSAETPLKLRKKLFKNVNSDTGKKLIEITENSKVNVGDLMTVRIELRVDRAMEFLHMKDMRASGVEPISVLSQYKYQDGLGYYESTRDASTNFFFDRVSKGVYVFEYDIRVNNAGDFSNGITTIQSMYAPEFSSHSEGLRLKVQQE